MVTRSGKHVRGPQLKDPELKLHLLTIDKTVVSPSSSKKVQFALQRNEAFGKYKWSIVELSAEYLKLVNHKQTLVHTILMTPPLKMYNKFVLPNWTYMYIHDVYFCMYVVSELEISWPLAIFRDLAEQIQFARTNSLQWDLIYLKPLGSGWWMCVVAMCISLSLNWTLTTCTIHGKILWAIQEKAIGKENLANKTSQWYPKYIFSVCEYWKETFGK